MAPNSMPSAEESEGPTIWANLGLALSFLFWRSKKPRVSYDISRLHDITKDTHSVLYRLRDGGLDVGRVSSIKKIAEYYDAVKHKKGNLATPTGEQAPINTPDANSGTVSKANIKKVKENVNNDYQPSDYGGLIFCISTFDFLTNFVFYLACSMIKPSREVQNTMSEEKVKAIFEKRRMMDQKAFALTDEERMHMCDMGFYNDVIRGYLIRAMKEADFQEEEIERALSGLRWALDSMTAAEAEKYD